VDVLVEIYTPVQYGEFEEKLRTMGFKPDKEAAFIGRFKIHDITVDIMPVEGEKILGFGNRWYKQAFHHIIQYTINDGIKVNILPVQWFIATKLEAFNARGRNDGRTSEDFEDIVFILQNRSGIWNDLRTAEEGLKQYLQQEFLKLLSNKYFEEWVAAHSSSSAAQTILFQIAAFTEE
jgi:predicted nucleotidyltransferase